MHGEEHVTSSCMYAVALQLAMYMKIYCIITGMCTEQDEPVKKAVSDARYIDVTIIT